MTTKELLIAARAKIDTPEKWCKGKLFMRNDCTGAVVQSCAYGALHAVTDQTKDYFLLCDVLRKVTGGWAARVPQPEARWPPAGHHPHRLPPRGE